MSSKLELMKDIIATVSVIIKLGVEGEILDTQTNLIAFLNEAGFRTVSGKEFTKMNFRQMFARSTPAELRIVMQEFNAQEDYEVLLAAMNR